MLEITRALRWVESNREYLVKRAEEQGEALAAEILALAEFVKANPDSAELAALFMAKVETWHVRQMGDEV
jgi:hypothetical protein